MPNKSIFCNLPWHGTRIYNDGSYGICCSEKTKLYSGNSSHNLAQQSISDWYNSDPVRQFRMSILGDQQLPACATCYQMESAGGESVRIKHNFKSAIFPSAFEKSFQQSPWAAKFEHSKIDGSTDLKPRYLHVDFGNECNLACKMCSSYGSSAIATVLSRTDPTVKPKLNWANDAVMWNNFLQQLHDPNLQTLHIIGGEPLLMRRFQQLIDYLCEIQRWDLGISFATNATVLKKRLIDQLQKFADIDIDVSLESVGLANDYIRQGSSITQLKKNIEWLALQQTDRLQVTLQATPQLLSICTYADLIEYAWDKQLVLEGYSLVRPAFMRIDVLPQDFRLAYVPRLRQLADKISANINSNTVTVGRQSLLHRLVRECYTAAALLEQPQHPNAANLQQQFAKHCKFWDNEYQLDLHTHVPHLSKLATEWGYDV